MRLLTGEVHLGEDHIVKGYGPEYIIRFETYAKRHLRVLLGYAEGKRKEMSLCCDMNLALTPLHDVIEWSKGALRSTFACEEYNRYSPNPMCEVEVFAEQANMICDAFFSKLSSIILQEQEFCNKVHQKGIKEYGAEHPWDGHKMVLMTYELEVEDLHDDEESKSANMLVQLGYDYNTITQEMYFMFSVGTPYIPSWEQGWAVLAERREIIKEKDLNSVLNKWCDTVSVSLDRLKGTAIASINEVIPAVERQTGNSFERIDE